MRGSFGHYRKVLLLLLIFAVVSCAGIRKSPKTGEELLRERVDAYWNLRVEGELDKTYQFEYPLYRKKVSYNSYLRRFSNPTFRFEDIKVTHIDVKDKEANIKLKVKVVIRGINRRALVVGAIRNNRRSFEADAVIKDKWIRWRDVWYHIPDDF